MMISLNSSATWISNKYEQEDIDTNWNKYETILEEIPSKYTISNIDTTSTQLGIYEEATTGDEILLTDGIFFEVGNLGGFLGNGSSSDISGSTYNSELSVVSQDTVPNKLKISPDGTMLYILGQSNLRIFQYSLSTPHQISTASLISSLLISEVDVQPQGLDFSSDGTKVYIGGYGGKDISQYNLSIPWDITTATYNSVFYIGSQDLYIGGFRFSKDGTKFYLAGLSNESIYRYDLSTAWEISTATYISSFSVVSQTIDPTDLYFSSDGSKMIVTGDATYQYSLSIPWDITTSSYNSSFTLMSGGIDFSNDGTKMYLVNSYYDKVFQYDVQGSINPSNIYDISSFNLLSSPTKAFKKPSDLYVSFESTVGRVRCQDKVMDFVSSTTSQIVTSGNDTEILKAGDEVTLSFSSTPDINLQLDSVLSDTVLGKVDVSTSIYESLKLTSEVIAGSDVCFSVSGDIMYVSCVSNTSIYSYILSTPWDITTAVYASAFNVGLIVSSPSSMYITPDGLSMFVANRYNNTVFKYSLSTPWDITSMTYTNESVSVQDKDTELTGLFFSIDGTRMFVTGYGTNNIYQYNLATPWDITTTTYTASFYIGGQEATIQGVTFSLAGDVMIIVGNTSDTLYQYNLTTPWDITTAVYASAFNIGAQDANAAGVFLSPLENKIYIMGYTNKSVFQYSILRDNDIVTYTSTFAAQPEAPTNLVLKDLSIKGVPSSYNLLDNTLTTTYNTVVRNGRATQFKVIGNTGNAVTKIQSNLWT